MVFFIVKDDQMNKCYFNWRKYGKWFSQKYKQSIKVIITPATSAGMSVMLTINYVLFPRKPYKTAVKIPNWSFSLSFFMHHQLPFDKHRFAINVIQKELLYSTRKMAHRSDQDWWQLTKKTLLEKNSHMFNNPSMSDIQFTCRSSIRGRINAEVFLRA